MPLAQLIKPTADIIADAARSLAMLLRMHDVVEQLQKLNQGGVRVIDTTKEDPGVPPAGVVYLYAWNGSLYARTATAFYVVAA